MGKISWSCIVIGLSSIVLSIVGIFFPLDGFIGCNLPFQFLLLLNSLNKGHSFVEFIRLPFFDYIFSIILIIAGIGTIRVRRWGRTCSYLYAIGIISLLIIGMPINFVAYIIKELIKISKESSFMDWLIWGGALAYIFTFIGALIYPVILLIFFSRPKIKEKFLTKKDEITVF